MDLRMDTLLEGAAEWTGCCVAGAGARRGGSAAGKGRDGAIASSEAQLPALLRAASGAPPRPPIASVSALKAPAPTSSPRKPKPSEGDPSKKPAASSTQQEKRRPKQSDSLRRRTSVKALVHEDSTQSRSSATDKNERKFNRELDLVIERNIQNRLGKF